MQDKDDEKAAASAAVELCSVILNLTIKTFSRQRRWNLRTREMHFLTPSFNSFTHAKQSLFFN